MNRLSSLTIAVCSACCSLPANAFTIDGNLADWGVNPTTWVPTLGTGIQYRIEDQTGSGSFFLNPGWGGQAYDAEALYAKVSQEDQKLYIALATGHNPRTPNQPTANSFGAGDFAIDFGKDGSYEVGINIKHVVSVAANNSYTFENFGVEGGVYRNATWSYGLWNSAGAYTNPNASGYSPDPENPTSLTGGSLVGMATLAYTTTPTTGYGIAQTDSHYFYEMSVDLQMLRDSGWKGEAFNIHWTENCANDSILVDPPAVPAPPTLPLIGLGLLGLILRRNGKTSLGL